MIVSLELEAFDPNRHRADKENEPEDPVEGEQDTESDDDGEAIGDEEDEAEGKPAANQA